MAAAVLATLFFPVVSLIAALFLLGRERDEAKRRDLRLWAWASAGWILAQALVFVALACAVFSVGSSEIERGEVERSGPCVGGPELGEAVETDENGRAVVPCAISGTATVTVP